MRCHVVALLIAMSLAAQGPPRDATALSRALASTEPKTVAFAAHGARLLVDARLLTDKTLVPVLQRALREWTKAEDAPASVVRLHLLDALLASKAKIPPADLLPLLDDPRCGTAAFVLLAREPKQNEAELFALFRTGMPLTGPLVDPPHLRTWAIGNLLCAQKTPGFAALVWRHTSQDLRVRVGNTEVPQRFGAGAFVGFNAPSPLLDGMPEEPGYELVRATQSYGKTDCFAPGDPGVGVCRSIRNPSQQISIAITEINVDGMLWLRQMAGSPAQPWRDLPIEFDTVENFRQQVTKAQAELLAFEHKLLRALVTARAMTEAEAASLPPTVNVVVEDQRTDQSKPLPKIPPAR